MTRPQLAHIIAEIALCAQVLRQLAAQENAAHHLAIEYRYERGADHLESARQHLSYILPHLPDPPGR